MVGELIIASGGRAMVLYTSWAALEASARVLRKSLAGEGIEVLAQGADGSRESLLARLQAGGRTALLGTASFWEGVDVRGAALSLADYRQAAFRRVHRPDCPGTLRAAGGFRQGRFSAFQRAKRNFEIAPGLRQAYSF